MSEENYKPSFRMIETGIKAAEYLFSGYSGERALTEEDRKRIVKASVEIHKLAKLALHEAWLGRRANVEMISVVVAALMSDRRWCVEDSRLESWRIVAVAMRAVQGGDPLSPDPKGQPVIDVDPPFEAVSVLSDFYKAYWLTDYRPRHDHVAVLADRFREIKDQDGKIKIGAFKALCKTF